ncbi:MAG: hypothetical protein IKF38_03160 [Clostridia bacterium]|nr:hypothetical protein [Clostridia bacterium]
MVTNLANLMSIVSEEEKKFSNYGYSLKDYAYNVSIQELDGKINVTEDYKKDFEKYYEELKKTQEKIIKAKTAIYEKNNSFKLSDGRTIQEAIVENTILRKMKYFYESMLNRRNSKKRMTEVNNSYFECKTLNYDVEKIQSEYNEIEKKIQKTDFEISKLNSKEFDVDI